MTSHWSSLAVVKSVYGLLTKELTTGDTILDSLTTHSTQPISVTVSAVCSMHTYFNVHVVFYYVCLVMYVFTTDMVRIITYYA